MRKLLTILNAMLRKDEVWDESYHQANRNFIGQDSCFFILKRIYHHAKLVLECATRSRLKRGSAPPGNLMFRHQ